MGEPDIKCVALRDPLLQKYACHADLTPDAFCKTLCNHQPREECKQDYRRFAAAHFETFQKQRATMKSTNKLLNVTTNMLDTGGN